MEQDDYEAAHEGLIVDPSAMATNNCAGCHGGIADSYADSLHLQLWGEKKTLALRSGVDTFEECPAALKDGYLGECTSCHATCGDCHVSRPDSVGKGFIKSHQFQAQPHQKNQCMACHGSRIAFDYMGDSEAGRDPDVHFSKGWNCMHCHSGVEMHAAAGEGIDRYHLEERASCEGCHNVATINDYHTQHWDDVACQVCHSQPYNNCTACHTNGEWEHDPIYAEQSPTLDFRIGLNHIADRRFKWVTVRHAPVATTSYDPWGAEGLLTSYDALPTWKYATPHSIRRWTDRTEVSGSAGCGTNCHLGAPWGSMDNEDLYLWEAYIQTNWPDEFSANLPVTVDDSLPASWE